ncbi:hypothetical protein BD769DRAFT_1361033, partial [Suillus cothurnatus]
DKYMGRRVRYDLAVIVQDHCLSTLSMLFAERCGAQGTFKYIHVACIEVLGILFVRNNMKGMIIAWLFSGLLLQRYRPLFQTYAHHFLLGIQLQTHSDSLNTLILPRAELAVEATGHALVYSAGFKSALPKLILDLHESSSAATYDVNPDSETHS